jgi:hypothetical protein
MQFENVPMGREKLTLFHDSGHFNRFSLGLLLVRVLESVAPSQVLYDAGRAGLSASGVND